jgi:hypothetical protein
LFTVESVHRYRWTIDLTTEQLRGLFSTFSDWTSEEVQEAADAVAGLGGSVSESYTSWLIIAAAADPTS